MPTLFQRLYAYRLEGIPTHRKQELGELVKATFFALPRKKNYYKVPQREGTEYFNVLCYDRQFREQIDQIILDFCKKYNFIPSPREPKSLPAATLPAPFIPAKKERKRAVKTLAYSAKSSKKTDNGK